MGCELLLYWAQLVAYVIQIYEKRKGLLFCRKNNTVYNNFDKISST